MNDNRSYSDAVMITQRISQNLVTPNIRLHAKVRLMMFAINHTCRFWTNMYTTIRSKTPDKVLERYHSIRLSELAPDNSNNKQHQHGDNRNSDDAVCRHPAPR